MAGENHESGGVSVTAPADTDDLEDRIEAQRGVYGSPRGRPIACRPGQTRDRRQSAGRSRTRIVRPARGCRRLSKRPRGTRASPRDRIRQLRGDRRTVTGSDRGSRGSIDDSRENGRSDTRSTRRRTRSERGRPSPTPSEPTGIRTATCENCDSSVDLALLNVPECPHCESPIADVVGDSSLFGSDRLVIGDPDESAPQNRLTGGPQPPEPTDQKDSTTDERR
ncbi:hypothetical protein D8S78_10695 [Natrialba swarupiae]|nr:hypothetical protein [Natrialba swarupiae]